MATKNTKVKLTIICENCDSEYSLKYDKLTVSSNPCYCAFCGEAVEDARDDDEYTDDDLVQDDYGE